MPEKKKIIAILRVVMLTVAAVCIITLPPWALVWSWLAPLPTTIQEQVDESISLGFDGMIVYVDQAGKEKAFYTGGWKNREHKIPADPQSLFKIASISKLYVAVCVAKLADDQRLSLEGTLVDHFPELKGRIENAENITLSMMLRHRSGIPNLTDHPEYPWSDPPKTSREALEYALDLPAEFAPDQDYAYSNTNYLLLAEIIDQVVGYSHHQFIREEILDPLQLSHTFFSLHEIDSNDLMSGYYIGYEPDIKMADYGSMLATAEDVGIFIRALNDGSLLSDSEQAIYSSVYRYEHSGLLPGFNSVARFDKKLDAAVVLFVNTSDGGEASAQCEIVCDRILEILKRDSTGSS